MSHVHCCLLLAIYDAHGVPLCIYWHSKTVCCWLTSGCQPEFAVCHFLPWMPCLVIKVVWWSANGMQMDIWHCWCLFSLGAYSSLWHSQWQEPCQTSSPSVILKFSFACSYQNRLQLEDWRMAGCSLPSWELHINCSIRMFCLFCCILQFMFLDAVSIAQRTDFILSCHIKVKFFYFAKKVTCINQWKSLHRILEKWSSASNKLEITYLYFCVQ